MAGPHLLVLDVLPAVSHELLDNVNDHLAALAHTSQALVWEVVRDELDQGRRKGEQHQEHGVDAERECCTDEAARQVLCTLMCESAGALKGVSGGVQRGMRA